MPRYYGTPLFFAKAIDWKHVRFDDENHVVIVENYLVRLSSTEYKLISPLLKKQIVSDNVFMQVFVEFEKCVPDKSHIDKYMSRIRNKIRMHGVDIYRIHGYGYILLPSDSIQERRMNG